MANVSKSISIPNEEFSDDTTPSFARKFLNEVKSTIVTLQRVVKQRMTLDIHNWSSSAHQEIHKIVKDEVLPIVNQVNARVQNFKIQFLKEAAKFVRDFKSLAKEADESIVKNKALELEIERLLRAVVSQDIMSVVQNNSFVDTSNLQTKLEQCKYDKFLYDKPYNDMQQKIKRLQAPFRDQKGKSKDTPYVSDTLDLLPQKLENENVELDCIQEPQSILGKSPSSRSKLYFVTPFLKSSVLPKVDKTNALSKPVTSNSAPSTRESKGVQTVNVIAPRIFKTNPSKTSKVDNVVPNKPVKANIRIKLIIVSQPHVITKNEGEHFGNSGNSQCVLNDFSDTQNQRDLPRNTPLDRVEVLGMIEKKSKVRIGIMPTESELALEQSQQGVSYEVSVSIEGVW
ncbi:hypothetical protein Tco_0158386 [Tanacetum coccineum]